MGRAIEFLLAPFVLAAMLLAVAMAMLAFVTGWTAGALLAGWRAGVGRRSAQYPKEPTPRHPPPP